MYVGKNSKNKIKNLWIPTTSFALVVDLWIHSLCNFFYKLLFSAHISFPWIPSNQIHNIKYRMQKGSTKQSFDKLLFSTYNATSRWISLATNKLRTWERYVALIYLNKPRTCWAFQWATMHAKHRLYTKVVPSESWCRNQCPKNTFWHFKNTFWCLAS